MTTEWTLSVITVGAGRGFLVEHENRRLVITAAHCLPKVPEPHPARYLDEITFERLLAPLGEEPEVWAECVFCDVISDLAVLGAPDGQELYNEHTAYEALTGGRPALPLGDIPPSNLREHPRKVHQVYVLGLGGEWTPGRGSTLAGASCSMVAGLRAECRDRRSFLKPAKRSAGFPQE